MAPTIKISTVRPDLSADAQRLYNYYLSRHSVERIALTRRLPRVGTFEADIEAAAWTRISA